VSALQLWDNPLVFIVFLVSIPLLLIGVAWMTEWAMKTGRRRRFQRETETLNRSFVSVREQVADRLFGGLDLNPVVENLSFKEHRGS